MVTHLTFQVQTTGYVILVLNLILTSRKVYISYAKGVYITDPAELRQYLLNRICLLISTKGQIAYNRIAISGRFPHLPKRFGILFGFCFGMFAHPSTQSQMTLFLGSEN
jgi:hypothetical protein